MTILMNGDYCLFTVRNVGSNYYEVTLDEYDDQPVTLFSLLDFRVGDISVGELVSTPNHIYLRTIDSLSDEDYLLYNLCFRLRSFDGPTIGWAKECRLAISNSDVHPYRLISDRSFVENGIRVFNREYNDCIRRNHAFIFGYYPSILEYNLYCNNPEKVLNFKNNFSRRYFHSQLWKDNSLYNLSVNCLYQDYYVIRVMAYLKSTCKFIMDEIIKYFDC